VLLRLRRRLRGCVPVSYLSELYASSAATCYVTTATFRWWPDDVNDVIGRTSLCVAEEDLESDSAWFYRDRFVCVSLPFCGVFENGVAMRGLGV
jgi:hypothetical protein